MDNTAVCVLHASESIVVLAMQTVSEGLTNLQPTIRPVGYLKRQDHVKHQILNISRRKGLCSLKLPKTDVQV